MCGRVRGSAGEGEGEGNTHQLCLTSPLAAGVRGGAQEVDVRDARHFHGGLEGHKQTGTCALLRIQLQQITTLELRPPCCHLVVWVPHLQHLTSLPPSVNLLSTFGGIMLTLTRL